MPHTALHTVSTLRKGSTLFIHSNPNSLGHFSIVSEGPDLNELLEMLNLSNVYRRHFSRLLCVFVFHPHPIKQNWEERIYIYFYCFFSFLSFCRFKYRLMLFLRVAYISLCTQDCMQLSELIVLLKEKSPTFLKVGKTPQFYSPTLHSLRKRWDIQRDIPLCEFEMAREVYYHPLKINFNVCSRSQALANRQRFTQLSNLVIQNAL